MKDVKTNILKTLKLNFGLEILAFTSSQMLPTGVYNSTTTDTSQTTDIYLLSPKMMGIFFSFDTPFSPL